MPSINNRFLILLLAALAFVGCRNQQQTDEMTHEPVATTLGVPMPTPEILAALGPANNVPIHRLLPDPIVAVAGKPKQFLASSASAGGELFVAGTIAESFQLDFFDIDPNDVEFIVQSNGVPVPAQVLVPNPQNPAAPPMARIIPIPRRATVVTFAEPVDLPVLLTAYFGVPEIDSIFLGSLHRTEGGNEYYDLTPPGGNTPQRLAIGLVDARTIVIVQGIEPDIRAVFSDVIRQNAVLERLRHTQVDTNDLTIITSLEGFPASPEEFEFTLMREGQMLGIPPTFIPLITQHLRALTLSLNVSASPGQPVATVYVEGRDERGTEAIREAIHGLIISMQLTMAMMPEDARQQLLFPADIAIALLNAISLDINGPRLNVALNNFDALIPFVADWLSNTQATLLLAEMEWQREALFQWRSDQLSALGELSAFYYMEHGRFPSDILDAQGTPLLSWRVSLLPRMGLEQVYNQFRLDEPWDSEANLEAKRSMPTIFHPRTPGIEPFKTVIRFFDSPGTPFANRDLRIEHLERQHSTLMYFIVSPEYAVEWTRPESLAFDVDRIAEILDEAPVGVTFSRRIGTIPVPRSMEPDYEFRRLYIEALVKGLPLPLPPE